MSYKINFKIKGLCLIIWCLCTVPTFADNAVPTMGGTPTYATVVLDGIPVSFSTKPLVLNNSVFVPATDLFNTLGIQTYWFPETRERVGYRDNTFVKFVLYEDYFYFNGKLKSLKAPVSLTGNEQLVPINDVADAFGLTYDFDTKTQTLSLDFRENIYQYKQIGFRQYKKINTSNWGISYFIPEYWERLDDGESYGVVNDFETYTITPKVLPLDIKFSRKILLDQMVKTMRYTYGKAITFGDEKVELHNGFVSLYKPYTLKSSDMTYNGILYVFFENNIGYVFDCRYDDENSRQEGETIFDDVMDTFQISRITIDTNTEHYIELSKFFEYNTKLNTEVYSNMLVDSHFEWSGEIGTNTEANLTGYHIVVSRDEETIQYYTPLISNTFNAEIPLPFGVGKHNISIYVDETDDATATFDGSNLTLDDYLDEVIIEEYNLDPANLLMRFSVINTSDDDMKYLLPSTYIDYDVNDVYTIANSITFDQRSDYAKARTVFEWMVSNYSYSERDNDETIATARAMLGFRKGNEFELTLAYTGLLRALDIPARIVRGINEDGSHYWVEVLLNGKWILADIAWEIHYKSDASVIPEGVYFDINSAIVNARYSKTELLPF